MKNAKMMIMALMVSVMAVVGCGAKKSENITKAPEGMKVVKLAWSEYPSWSVFGVADLREIVDGREGWVSPLERKYGRDIVLVQADYDTCITLYGSNMLDAVCITNMDTLAPALSRDSVAILPTSTSDGADACIVTNISNLDDLEGRKTYGLEKSVSQYAHERNIEIAGRSVADFPFAQMDPSAAAQAMQTNQKGIDAIMVWNPFVLQTLRTRDGATVLFDSTTIKEEIIDMVVMGKDAVDEKSACLIIEAFYEVQKLLADPKETDATHVALGAKFSNLGLADMKIVLKQTKCYKTPAEALALFNSPKFQNEIMPRVVKFCSEHGMLDKKVTVGFNDMDAQVNFSSDYINKVKNQ